MLKVASISKSLPSFQGYRPAKNERGRNVLEFNFPFDSNNFDCYLEIFDISEDGRQFSLLDNFSTDDGKLPLKNGKNEVDLSGDYFIDKDTPFAYHYKLVLKNDPNNVRYYVDAGDVIDNTYKGSHEIYNYVSPNGSKINRGGAMKLVITDNYNAGWQYRKGLFDTNPDYIKKNDAILERAKKSNKHFSNKIGGTLAGIEKSLENGDFDGYSSIISLPLFTDDSLSPHGYWNKNCMQMSQSLGSINNYASLQRKMFARGLNWVSDGAFVNEGLEGVHFANVLKWGEKSPYFNWFEASGLKNGPFELGVFGKNQQYISHKVVNSPYAYEQKEDGGIKISKNHKYDPSKPTYVQIFDKRLVTEKQKNDTENLIKAYDISNTDNPFEITTHDDTVINYHFEIDPEVYNKNVKNLNEYNRANGKNVRLDNIEGTRFVNKYENFELEDKIESNFTTWDANTDIAKLRYIYSHSDTEEGKNLSAKDRAYRDEIIKQNNAQVQDYVITSGMFWTQKTKDILTTYIAQNLKNINPSNPKQVYDNILKLVDNKILPQRLKPELSESVVKNVISGKYDAGRIFSDDSFEEQLKKEIMNFPLDAVELGDNIIGVLASPFMTKRAINEDQIGLTRYDMYKIGNPQVTEDYARAYNKTISMYNNEMMSFADDIVSRVQKLLPQDLKDNKYSNYVLPLIAPEIAKFALVKSIKPDAKVYVNAQNGEIAYDYDELKQTSLQGLGINGASPEDEALSLISKIRKGILSISDEDRKLIASAIAKSLEGTSIEGFALADMIIDRTQSGLDWRIDATKDIASMDAMRNRQDSFEDAYNNIVSFWKRFNQSIYKVNPNAYTVAEITDEFDQSHVVKDMLNQTGMTSIANYSYFFNGIIMMLGKMFEYDAGKVEDRYEELEEKIHKTLTYDRNYLTSSNLPSLEYSYTFIGNHDKPRALHGFGLDMGMFFANLNDEGKKSGLKATLNQTRPQELTDYYNYLERAYRLVEDRSIGEVSFDDVINYDYSKVSPKAVAMGELVRTSLIEELNSLSANNENFANNHSKIFEAVSKSVADLVKGEFLNENFNADAFGVNSFDVAIDAVMTQAKRVYEVPIDKDSIKVLKDRAFERMTKASISKLKCAMKYLVALPGKPTLYAGDDLVSTGYDEKTKNIYLKNRNYIHNEWLEEKPFVKETYDELNSIMALRSRPELDALNNGSIHALPVQNSSDGNHRLSAIFRENSDGKMAISLFNTAGITHDSMQEYVPQDVYLKEIVLSKYENNVGQGITSGLTEGTEFVNAKYPKDIMKVYYDNGRYVLRHEDGSDIKVDDSTMILYHVPKNSKISFTGYKPLVGDVVRAYAIH